MSWREELQLDGDGSFRGVKFRVSSAQTSMGRRTVLHEFPGSDHVESEDLGRATRRYTFDAFIVGPDYFGPRDQLREAFETPGPGPLVHPFLGEVVVIVEGPVQMRETTAEGGMVRFSLTVVRVVEDIVRDVPDREAELEIAIVASETALEEVFVDSWTVTGVIEEVRTAAQALVNGVNGVTSMLNRINGYANALMNIPNTIGDSITALADNAATLILSPQTLVSTLRNLKISIVGSIAKVSTSYGSYFGENEAVGSLAGSPETSPTGATPATGRRRVEALMVMFRDMTTQGNNLPPVVETTPQRTAESRNQAAMSALIQGLGVVETCRGLIETPFASLTQATAVRDEITEKLDALADVADDTAYGALVTLRIALVKYLADVSADLPRVITYTPLRTLPALVIAQHLYSDSTRANDIIDRNNLRNPARVSGGVELEVLSRD